jgi:hypothetical protein
MDQYSNLENQLGVSSGRTMSVFLRQVASTPFIYLMMFPLVIFHFFLEIYHYVCFRLYDIPLVDRREYFVYKRELMKSLNLLDKFNCVYCSYANNLLLYAVEIAGRTERYWCPLKYEHKLKAQHSQYQKFLGKEDLNGMRSDWERLKDFKEMKK